jgi:hypothetical protein
MVRDVFEPIFCQVHVNLEIYLNLYLSSSCEFGDLFEPVFIFRTVINQHVN